MNILVLHSQVPFTRGGAEVLVDGLVGAIGQRGHNVDLVSLPLTWNPVDRLLTSALAWSLLDLSTFNGMDVDLVVCTKFPTWAIQHPRKVLWLIHQHRQAYDLHGSSLSEFGPDADSRSVRRHVQQIDRRGIAECEPRFAISSNVGARLKQFTGIEAAALYPPVPHTGLQPDRYDPFILSVSRIDDAKRVSRIVDAWSHVKSELRLVIVGSGPAEKELRQFVRRQGLEGRIELLGRVSDARAVELYNTCRGVFYAPIDEDYGYAAVEALAAGKPVVTSADSGGVLEFVTHDYNGLITSLDSEELAQAVDRLADERFARHLGSHGPALTADLSWDNVIASLLGAADAA